jgi:hypothetical protein
VTLRGAVRGSQHELSTRSAGGLRAVARSGSCMRSVRRLQDLAAAFPAVLCEVTVGACGHADSAVLHPARYLSTTETYEKSGTGRDYVMCTRRMRRRLTRSSTTPLCPRHGPDAGCRSTMASASAPTSPPSGLRAPASSPSHRGGGRSSGTRVARTPPLPCPRVQEPPAPLRSRDPSGGDSPRGTPPYRRGHCVSVR